MSLLTDGQKYANPRVKSGHWKPLRDGLQEGHMSQVTGDVTIFDFTDKYEVFEERRHGIDGCLYTFDEWHLRYGDCNNTEQSTLSWEHAQKEGAKKATYGIDLRELHYITSEKVFKSRNDNPQYERPIKPLCCMPGYGGLVPKLVGQNIIGTTVARSAKVAHMIDKQMQEDHDSRYMAAANFNLGEACKDYLAWDQQNKVFSSQGPVSSKGSARSE